MQLLKIDETKLTPAVSLDPHNHLLEIVGSIYPENVSEFFGPIQAWVNEYMLQKNEGKTKVLLNLSYLNSSASKQMWDLVEKMEQLAIRGVLVELVWQYDHEDDLMQEFGEELVEDFKKIEFNLKALEN